MSCGKKNYPSRKKAKAARKRLNNKYPDQKLTNIYYCDECVSYHLTSMKKKKSRFLTRRNNNIKKN